MICRFEDTLLTAFGWLILSAGIYPTASGQSQDYPIQTGGLPGLEVVSTNIYEGNGLWGYIDGGADIYHEYGFERVYVQELSLDGQSLKAESYCMTDGTAAFGIFSVNRYRCGDADSIRTFHCISPYQILATIDRHYLVISNQTGTEQAIRAGTRLLHHIAQKAGNTSLFIPEPYTMNDAATDLKCMKGELGMMNGYPFLSDLLEPYREYILFLLELNRDGPASFLGRIEFTEKKQRDEFVRQLEAIKNNNVWGSDRLIYLKITSPHGAAFMVGDTHDAARMQTYLVFFQN